MIDVPKIHIKRDDIIGSVIEYFQSLDYEKQQELAVFCSQHSWFVDSIITQNHTLVFWDISPISKQSPKFFQE